MPMPMPMPLVLVPGLLCSAEVWAPQISALWPDRSIHVASTLAAERVKDVATAILDAAPDRFALAGISMGGYLCLEMMRQAPERIERLALLDTSARPDTPEQTAGRWALLEQLTGADFVPLATKTLSSIMHPAHQGDPTIEKVNAAMARIVGREGLLRHTRIAISRPDSLPSLAAIEVPTLVLVGAEDPITPPELSAELASNIAGARLEVIPTCGHSSTLEQPDAVTARLLDWLNK